MSQNVDEELSFKVGEEQSGQRLDKALSGYCPDISRARLQSLIKGGQVSVNGIAETKASEKIDQGDRLRIIIPPPKKLPLKPRILCWRWSMKMMTCW